MNKRIKRRLAHILEKLPLPSTILGPPKRTAWDITNDIGRDRKIFEVETPSERLIRPEVLLGIEYESFQNTLIKDIKPLRVACLAQGRYFQPTFAVVDRSDTLLYDYTQGWDSRARHNNFIFEEIRLPRPKRLPGKTLLLDVRSHSQNYFHWVIEGLSKIPAVTKAGISLDEISHFLVSRPERDFHIESFRRAGISLDRVVDASQYPNWQCDELIAVSDTREFLYQNCINYLLSLFVQSVTENKRRIFISRRDASSRRISNEKDLIPVLNSFGFEIVTLSGLSVEKQAYLFGSAECIVAPHGAGLTNLIFAKPGTLLIELHSPNYLKALYLRISSALGLRYSAMLGEASGTDEMGDILLDPARLNSSLHKLLC